MQISIKGKRDKMQKYIKKTRDHCKKRNRRKGRKGKWKK